MFVHGGPIPVDLPATPRDWPVYRGYGTLAALAGCAGLVVDHPLHGYDHYATAAAAVTRAITDASDDARIDPTRVGIWVFSGGGPFVARLIDQPADHLRVIAATSPILVDRPGRVLPDGFHPVDSVRALTTEQAAAAPPIVLTSVGLEAPEAAAGVDQFIAAAALAGLSLTHLHVAQGVHGFDSAPATDEGVTAVHGAVRLVTHLLHA